MSREPKNRTGISSCGGQNCPARAYFRAQEEVRRLDGILKERVMELIGGVAEPWMVRFLPEEEGVVVDPARDSLSVTPESQRTIYDLGFRRIFLNHLDGSQTYYYDGGDPRGDRPKARGHVIRQTL